MAIDVGMVYEPEAMKWTHRAGRTRWSDGPGAGLLCLLAACAEPRFDEKSDGGDAGSETCQANCPDAEAEAAAPSTEPNDPVRDKWIGRYAVRTAMYAVDGILQNAAQLLSLVEIAKSGDGLVLDEQLCKFEGGWNAVLVEGQLRFIFPETKHRAQLNYDATSFSSTVNVFTFGYGESPAGCATAGTLPLVPAPPWLEGGDCLCVPGGGPPNDSRDCRIVDHERDGQPGFTFQILVSGVPWRYYGVQEERIRYLNGYKQGDRLFAGQEFDLDTRILACSGPPAGDCMASDGVSCPSKYNRSEFAPIGADFDCARVIDEEAGLFPVPVGRFPAGCAADLK